VTDVGSPVSRTANPAAAPTMTGGTIADGTYVLVADVNYGTSTPASNSVVSATLVISGTSWQIVITDHVKTQSEVQSATVATSGNELTTTTTCGGQGTGQDEYTATATTLSWLDTTKLELVTWQKQ
jgi:hypothetical protein